MALYTRIGIATSKKRMWPFQIDRIGSLPWSADILSAVRGHPARIHPLTTAADDFLDTNAGIAPAFHRANGAARPPDQGEGMELSDSWPIKSKHLFRGASSSLLVIPLTGVTKSPYSCGSESIGLANTHARMSTL